MGASSRRDSGGDQSRGGRRCHPALASLAEIPDPVELIVIATPPATPGHIAFVSQSGALCAAIVDWAANRDVGFSSLVSLGSAADVTFGEIIDFLVSDPETKSILLYIEGIRDARGLMSSLR